mmetsp:Transcript_17201/g.39874  ORF Transcript_17201/g.39874 Transcript_17201/m.39874 type:complete len:248 (+) Transcript_17201:526-1269(+)
MQVVAEGCLEKQCRQGSDTQGRHNRQIPVTPQSQHNAFSNKDGTINHIHYGSNHGRHFGGLVYTGNGGKERQYPWHQHELSHAQEETHETTPQKHAVGDPSSVGCPIFRFGFGYQCRGGTLHGNMNDDSHSVQLHDNAICRSGNPRCGIHGLSTTGRQNPTGIQRHLACQHTCTTLQDGPYRSPGGRFHDATPRGQTSFEQQAHVDQAPESLSEGCCCGGAAKSHGGCENHEWIKHQIDGVGQKGNL